MKRNLHLAQQGVYFDQLLDLEDPRYNCGGYMFVRTRGVAMDYELLETVIKAFYRQHDAFNIDFDFSDPTNPKCSLDKRLRKNDSRDPILTIYDYTKGKNAHKAALKLVHELFAEPIDLFGEHLAFLYLIKLSKDSFYFVFKFHHIIVDGYSFIPIVASLYHTYISTKCPSETLSAARSKALLSENCGSYYEEIKRSEAYEKSAQFLADQQYWRATFKDIPEPLFAKKALDKRGFSTVSKPLDKALRGRLTQISQESNYSLQKLLTAASLVILCRLYGKERIVIGVPRHNRVGKRQKRIVGMLSGVVPFIGQYQSDMSVLDLLKEKISLLQRQTYKHGKYPLTRIIREVKTSDLKDRTVIDLVVNYEPSTNAEIDSEFAYSRGYRVGGGDGSFPLEVGLYDYGVKTPMVLKVDYLHAYCKAEEVESLLERLVFVLEQISRSLDEKCSAIKLLSPEEERELLETFNHTEVAYPRDKTVVDLFSQQVSKTPDNLAVVYEEEQLTYRELDKKSSQLAHYLLSKGVKKEELVAICMERSLEMIIGILGIMKSGGAYVPLDPSYPRQRLAYMLEDTGSRILLSTSALRVVVEGYDRVTPVYLDKQQLSDYPSIVPDVGLSPHNLAYVIYTSGSTGKPKGVLTEHKNVARLFFNDAPLFDFNESDVWSMFHSYNFDFSVWEMYGALLHGGKLVVLSKEQTKDPALFCALIQQQGVTVLSQTPSSFSALQQEVLARAQSTILRYVILGGEALYPSLLDKWKSTYKSCRLINMYGITETTVHVTFKEITAKEIASNISDIGVPIPTLGCVILDEGLQLQPKGIVGELCIGGAGLARGYLNQPDLTAEKFVENPFRAGERLYRTGDLARWLPDGNLEFLGRKDHQVKIRGYRIELGEIESQLQGLPELKQAVVLAREDKTGSKYLVAYVVLEEGKELDSSILQAQLKSQLPDYMVPRFYMQLNELPLTANGKLDRGALPEPEGSVLQRQAYIAPRTALEQALAPIWQGVLGVEQIGIYDDFFALGGDSIKAIQLRSRIRKLGYDLGVKDLFDNATLEASVKQLRAARAVQSETGILSGALPLLPIQQRFFEAQHQQAQHYNQSVLLSLSKRVTAEDLQAIVPMLSTQHDALRLQYRRQEKSKTAILQRYSSKEASLEIEAVSSRQAIADLCEGYQASLDIAKGPLARFVWMQTPESESDNRLLITIHHLGIDGVSWRILLEDFSTLLSQRAKGEPLSLEPKQSSYRQWGSQLSTYAGSAALLSERSYWAEVLREVKALPQDKDYTGVTPYREVHHHTEVLSQAQTRDLLGVVHRAYGTEINDLLLSALSLTLLEWMGGDSVVIGLEGHGREELFEDLDTSRTLGWFTSLYPIALQATPGGADIGQQIIATKESLRSIPHKGIGYGILRYLAADEGVRAAMEAPFDAIVFNYLGEFDGAYNPRGGLFSQAAESMGSPIGPENPFEHTLSLNSMVVQGALRTSWSYDSNRYEEETIRRLASRYQHYLSEVIAHCKGVEEPIKTASDYGLPSTVSQSELESFKAEEHHPAVIEDLYPLSPLQEGLLFHSLYDSTGQAYQVHLSCDFKGGLEGQAFREAWQQLSEKHSILRTAFFPEALCIPVQVVYREVELPIEEIDYSAIAADGVQSLLSDYLLREKARKLDLTQAPLLRLHLFYLPGGGVRFHMTNHHILWDGWSLANLMGELLHVYEGIVKGATLPKPVADNYVDLLRYTNRQSLARGEAYWREYLLRVESPSYVPYLKDVSRRNELSGNTEEALHLSPDLSKRLIGYGQTHGLTVNTLLQGAWAYLLSRYNNQEAVIFGTTVSGRDIPLQEIERRVGLYINTLPVAAHIDPEADLADWLKALQSGHTRGRTEYSYMPLSTIQGNTTLQGSLFDSLMVFENYPIEKALQGEERLLEIDNVRAEEGAHYVLSLICYQSKGQISIRLGYHSALLDRDAVERIGGHFVAVLEGMVSGAAKLGALHCLSQEERTELLETFNHTEVAYPRDKTVVDLFSEQVSKTPDNLAVVFEEEQLTYRELDKKSSQLAHYLLSRGVKKEELVAICMERSLEMIIGILGIIKSGAAYVPLDPAYPRERLAYMLEDAGSRMILSTSTLRAVVEGYDGVTPVYLDKEALGDYPGTVPEVGLTPENLVYVIYTSGSTGKPKGVLTEHKNVVRLFFNDAPLFDFNESDVWSMFHSYNFDFSVWEMYGALLHGGKLVVLSKEQTKDPALFCELIQQQRVTVLNQTPSSFRALQQEVLSKAQSTTLRYIILGGEALYPSLLDKWKATYKACRLINMYGITETTVHVTFKEITAKEIALNISDIGVPIPTLGCVILDECLQLQPKGIVGELCIGGAGLARGYLNHPDLTRQKFIENPFRVGERLYRTGDLARWLPDGNLEFLGRKDHQVKIRGYRIELGEIEHQLQALPELKQVAVLAKEDATQSKYLVAYVVLEEGKELDPSALQTQLKSRLPDYMVPRFYMQLTELPLTANGKLDRAALPEPEGSALQRQAYVAPRTELEQALVSIWQEVLGVEQIGIYDDFFALGGDSIKAMRLVAQLRAQQDKAVKVRAVFEAPTIAALVEAIAASSQSGLPPIEKAANRPDRIPLSYSQERLWILDSLGGSTHYHIPGVFRLRGELDIPALKRSLVALAGRHEVLRSVYEEASGAAYQRVLPVSDFGVEELDLRLSTVQQRSDTIETLVSRPFDLSRDCMLRVGLLKEDKDRFLLLIVLHHIAADGWSMPILLKELAACYKAYKQGKPPELLTLSLQYADYSLWQRAHLSGAVLEAKLNYWEAQLKGVAPLALPLDYPRPAVQSKAGLCYEFTIDQAQTAKLRALSRESGVTLFMTLLSVYKVLLYRYSAQGDICVGTPVANREQQEIASLVGFFVNTLALRTEIKGEDTFEQVLDKVKSVSLSAYSHQDAPFERVVERVVQERDQSHSPLFQTMFVLQNNEQVGELVLGSVEVKPVTVSYQTSKFDLTLSAEETSQGLSLEIEYCSDLFREDTIVRMAAHYKQLVEAVLADPAQPIGVLNYLSRAEQVELLETFNHTEVAYPRDKTVVDLFSEQVARTPDNLAVVCEGEQLTYRELDKKSSQLAHYLLSKGVKREDLVAICMERSLALIVGILGIMKSGGAYVPLDPTYPRQRLAYILEDAGSRMILSTSALREIVEGYQGVNPVYLDKAPLVDYPCTVPEVGLTPENLVYVIYTSGSTGKPKGVMVEQGGLVNMIVWHQQVYGVEASSRSAPYARTGFDSSVCEIYPYLIAGASLYPLASDEIRMNVEKLERFLRDNEISHCCFPSQLCHAIIDRGVDLEGITILAAGDILKIPKPTNLKLYNNYGPTENTVVATWFDVGDRYGPSIPIGKPIDNVQVYILDEHLQLQPKGIIGELCIGGAQLARGYLNRPDLTRQKFIENPFRAGERLYRTGDLARWLPDGNLEFIGRKDHQVKIRGYRIELGEIESQLQGLPELKQAVVLAKEDGTQSKYLVAYVVLEEGKELDPSILQTHLKAQLPDYMVPRFYMQLTELPLTANGKLDRAALPEPERSALQRQAYVAPRTELEQTLAPIWQRVLGIEQIGIYDDFFALGGDSIKAIQLRSRIRKLGYDLGVKDLFENPTLEACAKQLRAARAVQSETGILSGALPLLPIQQRFFKAQHKQAQHYNQSVLLSLSKSVTAEDLQAIVSMLSTQHDALRLQYQRDQEGKTSVLQRYSSKGAPLEIEAVSNSRAIADLCEGYQASLDIAKGPLARFVWMQTPESESDNRLLITIHHLGIDGVSWRILLEDFSTLLSQRAKGQPLSLEPKQSSYRQWGAQLLRYAGSPALLSERPYWAEVLREVKALPQDKDYTGVTPYREVHQHTEVLSQAQTRDLLGPVHRAYGTEINDLLLSALSFTLAEWSGGDRVVISLEGHGREDLFEDIDTSRTLGWFTSLYPVALQVTTGRNIGDQIIATKESLRRIPHKGIGYGLLRCLATDESVRAAMEAPFDAIVFNYLGEFDGAFSSSGGLFSRATESMGSPIGPENTFEQKLSINSLVVRGALRTSWSYDSNRYKEETICRLAARYQHTLSEIIAHCKEVEEPIKTASDYGLPSTVSQSELEAFKAEERHPAAIEDLYPLSPLQEGLLFHSLYDRTGEAYQVHFSCDFKGGLQGQAFRKAWQQLSEKHSILRTAIYPEALSIPVQVVYREVEIPIEEIDYRAVAADGVQSLLSDYLLREKAKKLGLTQAPLLRLKLFYLPGGGVHFHMTNHHILWDGWSFANLMGELLRVYEGIVKGATLPELIADNYVDLLRYINRQSLASGEAYWREYLLRVESPSYVPYLKDASRRNKLPGNTEETLHISSDLSERLISYSQTHGLTVNTLLQGAWAYLLSRYNNQEAVVFGATVSGRDIPLQEIERRVGLYINTLPVAAHVDPEADLADWLKALQSGHTRGRTEYSYMPLSVIQATAGIQGPLFDSLMVFENYPVEKALQGEEQLLEIDNVRVEEDTHYVLSLICYQSKGQISIRLGYHSALLDRDAVERIGGHFVSVLEGMASGAAKPGDLHCLSQEERTELLETFNHTEVAYPRDKTVVDLFSEQINKTPDNIAVVFEDGQLTYRELDKKSSQLAHYLLSKGVKREDLVAICMERSLEMIIGILGIIKSGAAYVPLDPAYPRQRLAYMVEDTGSHFVLSTSALRAVVEGYDGVTPVYLDKEALADYPGTVPEVGLSPENLAYVIYTSGSTGKPKGVMIEHKNVVRLFFNDAPLFDFNQSDVWSMFHSYSFDVSVWEMYGALLHGGKLVVLSKEQTKDPALFCELIVQQGVTVLSQTPSSFDVLQEELLARQASTMIRCAVFAGEALYPSTLSKWKASYENCSLINMYGTTETTVHASFKEITLKEIESNINAIGIPLPTLGYILLDKDLQLQPKGIVGELCIGGAGLARGYLNRPDLTAEKFLENPFRVGERLYRTGDLARWLADGNLEFLGRKDHQVKIRGYRIELGEIEHQLHALPELKQAVVLAREDKTGSKYLVAYVVLEEGKELDPSILQTHLKAQLPDYMVPRFYMQLTELPLTSNGKLDRGALPNPDGSALQRQVYVAPRTELEQALVSIWQEVLGVEKIGVYDDFFELGGHSLMTIRLITKINTRLATHLEISVIYESPTIDLLSQRIKLFSVDKAPSLLVKIKQGSGNSTLFYAPPLAGTLFQAFDLGKFLHSEFTLYGFQQCDPIYQQYHLFESIEEMASAYVDELLKLERTENLYLMGYSFGAVVAYEMLLQLQKRDVQVSKLIVLDRVDPRLEPYELRDSDTISAAITLLKEYNRSNFNQEVYEAIKEKPWSEVSALICNAVPFLDRESLEGIARVMRRNSCCSYHTAKGSRSIATSIDVLMAKEVEEEYKPTLEGDIKKRMAQYKRGWEGFTNGAVNIISIEGAHESILSSQHIEKLAEIINSLIPVAFNPSSRLGR